jgi:hypothetical protein
MVQVVKAEQEKALKAAAEAKEIKDDCERELAVALPILKDALTALDTIKEADVAYVRKLGNPPAAIKFVMEAVCVILGVKPAKAKDEAGRPVDDFWKPSVALLNDKDFLTKLKSYDKDNIPAKVLVIHRQYNALCPQQSLSIWHPYLNGNTVFKCTHADYVLLHVPTVMVARERLCFEASLTVWHTHTDN